MRVPSTIAVLVLCESAMAAPAIPADRPLLASMEKELQRSFRRLKNAGAAPLYFLAYRIYDSEVTTISATHGALDGWSDHDRSRSLQVDVRVGSPKLDNTHRLRTQSPSFDPTNYRGLSYPVPIEDDDASLRAALWADTDTEFKVAQKKLTEVRANRSIRAAEEDPSDDFSIAKSEVHLGAPAVLEVDRATWEKRAREVSAIFREEPAVQRGTAYFYAGRTRRSYVNSEGTKIQDESVRFRITLTAQAISDDGMDLWLYDDVEVPRADLLPDERDLIERARRLSSFIRSLRSAPPAEPYVGPAILSPLAAGVFFHEVFGHRIEGHRQKWEEEGRTFKGKVGRRIMPEFISVTDDPLRQTIGDTALSGAYLFDDEGVRAQGVSLVDRGVLKGFLMSRSPIDGFPRSNGHGRSGPGGEPVARQGNLIVESSKRVPPQRLREMLIEELKRQDKPYGLYFDQIAGGFTMTQTSMPQAFKVLPLRVFKVHVDGRPDEEVRGVDIVGTPLTSLERILATGDDDSVFNGTCGAESGWVPVSAVSPSLLVGTIEVERREKSHEQRPILPAPGSEKKKRGAR